MIELWADKSKNELNQNKFPVLLPIGSLEQHGNHLPVGTDSQLNVAVINSLIEKYQRQLNLSILPQLNYGKSTEHSGFPGTITLSAHTLLSIFDDISQSLKMQGILKLIIFNSHGGNVGLIGSVLYDIRQKYGIQTYAIHLGALFGSLGGKCAFPTSMHAGYVETAVMQYLYPQYEHLFNRIPKEASRTPGYGRLEELNRFVDWGWATEELSEQGYMGDPSQATAKDGADIFTRVVDLLYEQLSLICER